MGLLGLGNGVADNVLKNLGMNLENVRAEVKRQMGIKPDSGESNYLPLTPRARRVLDTAKSEAKALGHTYVGTEDCLLGLLAEKDGMAWRIFKMANIDPEKMRQEILSEITPIISPPGEGQNGKS